MLQCPSISVGKRARIPHTVLFLFNVTILVRRMAKLVTEYFRNQFWGVVRPPMDPRISTSNPSSVFVQPVGMNAFMGMSVVSRSSTRKLRTKSICRKILQAFYADGEPVVRHQRYAIAFRM
jgi:hypothetical protein